ncbi:hypothetical protein [Halorussus salinus]|uniref:hypothetical protein n=1 Tax=Halorussus salinus TaxID=1364935 RepID=UPI0010932310|nr:hypothetical protein [Halorussus salinus]
MNIKTGSLIAFLLVATFLVSGSGVAEKSCTTENSSKVCVNDLSVSPGMLLVGEKGNISVVLENKGSEPVSAVVTLNTAGPNNTTSIYQLGKPTLMPGETRTVSTSLNGSTPGIHGFRVLVSDADSGKVYGTSEIETIEVRSEPPVELGGPFDRSEFALFALLFSVSVVVGLICRQYRKS